MYLVAATVLGDFWNDHPACEAELRALHALLANASITELEGMQNAASEMDGRRVKVNLASSCVTLDINEAAQVARIVSVEIRKAD